jgi:hypothetical protein
MICFTMNWNFNLQIQGKRKFMNETGGAPAILPLESRQTPHATSSSLHHTGGMITT